MSSIGIGSMRHVVLIETPATVSDGQGGFTRGSYTTFFRGYACIKPLSAKELMYASQKLMPMSHKVTMRWRRDKTPDITMRVNYTIGSVTRYFAITGIINEDERSKTLTMACMENVGT